MAHCVHASMYLWKEPSTEHNSILQSLFLPFLFLELSSEFTFRTDFCQVFNPSSFNLQVLPKPTISYRHYKFDPLALSDRVFCCLPDFYSTFAIYILINTACPFLRPVPIPSSLASNKTQTSSLLELFNLTAALVFVVLSFSGPVFVCCRSPVVTFSIGTKSKTSKPSRVSVSCV